ncbi:clusterin-associated protein 1 homolog [Planococcus citri]|uniref:clusterin-associated protein 1 homolog n=1 Tax=Planococcus citri TaxID=170843 RepID=UPI0031FA483C
MSFREVRNFTEILKTLGYRRLISYESFRQPNFHLVADILVWLVKRFDNTYDISDDCSTSERRILLIRSVAEFMVLKTGLKLNLKKLYQADGHAVKEMLKIAALLHEALKMKQNNSDEFYSLTSVDLSAKIQELKLTRELALQITRKGSSLFELLKEEPLLRETRTLQANAYVDLNEIETLVKNIINDTTKNIVQMKQQIENISSTESNLDMKINKKENDLERIGRRLETLKNVRPAFLEEYERYEEELNQIYDNYVNKFRCYTYLQQHLQQLHTLNRDTANFMDSNAMEDADDKMSSLIDEGSLSSSTPPPVPNNKPPDAIMNAKKTIGRIRTAVDSRPIKTGNRMYDNVKDESEDLDDDDDDDDLDDELLDGDSILRNDTEDDSDLQHSNTDNFKLSDNKSDDTF